VVSQGVRNVQANGFIKVSIKKIICLPDIQAPKHDEKALSTALQIVRKERPDTLILVGDVVDLQSVSRFPPKDWDEAGMTASQELRSANSILDRIDAVSRKAEKIYLEGNHDRRLEIWFVQNGSKLGCDFNGNNVQTQLGLLRRGYKYIPIRQQPYRIGKVAFIHGWFTNKYHAFKTVSSGGQNLIYGHTHDFQVYTGLHLDEEAPRMAMSIGCLCDFRQGYLEGKPMNWIHGIGLIYIDTETGKFWPQFVPIIDGEAVINGRRFKA
jgi:predicted phosphodiesterase